MRIFNYEITKLPKARPPKAIASDEGKKAVSSEIIQRIIRIGGRPVIFNATEFSESNVDLTNANVGLAVKIIGNNVSTLPLMVRRKARVNGKTTWVDEPDHDALQLFKEPNPHHSQYDIFTHIVQSLVITGKSYITMNPMFQKPPTELRPHPSWMFNIKYDKATGWPSGYIYDPYQKKINFELEEVLYTHFYHMSSPFEGANPLSAIMDEIKSNFYAIKWHQEYFKNSASPDVLFLNKSLKGMSPEEEEKFLTSWARRHKGYKKAFNAGILPSGFDFKQLDQKIKDLVIDTIITLNREQILGFLMVPPSEAGVLKDASYANAMMQKRSFWENSLIPLVKIYMMSINRQVIWPNWSDEFELYQDISGVAALQEDKAVTYKAMRDGVEGGFLTPNDARRGVGQEPIEDENADKLRIAPMPVPSNAADGGKSLSVKSAADDDPPDPRVMHWKAFDEKTIKYESSFVEIIEKFFEAQKKRVLNNLSGEATARGAFFKTWLFKMKQEPPELKRGDSQELPDHIIKFFNIQLEDEALEGLTKQPITDAVAKSGQAFIASHNLDISFNLKNPDVLTSISQQVKRIKYINDDTFVKLKSLLDDAYDNAWTINQLESGIKDLYDKWIVGDWDYKLKLQSRARTIARTEMGAAVNGGEYFGQLQAGVTKREWLATVDGNTRFEHAIADGQKVDIQESFTVGGEKLRYPSDPNGSPGNVINCRCTVIEYFD